MAGGKHAARSKSFEDLEFRIEDKELLLVLFFKSLELKLEL